MKTIIKALFLTNLLLGVSSINAQNFDWARSFEGTFWDYGYSISIDGLGNVYTIGRFTGTTDFDPGPETAMLSSAGDYDVFVQKMDASGNFLWAKSFGGTGADAGNSICVNASGDVYSTGYYTGTADFDPTVGITANLTAVGNKDVFVQKMDASGNFLWAKSFGGVPGDEGRSIAIDTFGNVYTTGYASGTIDFDPGTGITNLTTTSANPDIFVQKMDNSGNFLWAKTFGGGFMDRGHSIETDASGNVYTTGYFQSTSDFDPGPDTFNLTSAGATDIFVQKMDALGNFLWAKSFGGVNDDNGNSIAVDASGNVYTTGIFQNTVDFNPGSGATNFTSAGNEDIFVQKMDALGNFLWAKVIGGISTDGSESVCIDGAGDIYITGYFAVTVDFNPDLLDSFNLTASGIDIFVQKMDASGNFLWAKSFGGTDNDYSNSISVDVSGDVYTTGYFRGTADFDPGTGTTNLTSAGGFDVFVHKMNRIELNGYVFEDTNGNGLKDLGEIPVPMQTISYSNGNDATITNEDGFFRAFPPLGDQVFSLQLPSYYTNTTPLSQTVDVQLDITDTLYFGIQLLSEANDLLVEIHPYTSPRPGFTRNYQLSYQNVGTTVLDDVTLKFLKSTEDNVISATGNYTVSDDTLIWNLGTLEPFAYGSFTITNTLSASATLGDSTHTQAWILPSADDATPENNVVVLSEEIIGSYDPNDKTVTPEISEPTENEPLEYMVRFQNTGNYQADFVVVRDTLSTLLDLTTFQMIAASHNYELAIENRIATWTFANINLPDSTSDEPGSHGFIKFKVQRVDGLGLGTQIPNRVGIYFDYNAPVITNTCVYSIETCISTRTDVQTACNSYTWIDGNTYTTSNNTATHVLNNGAGCDSIVTLSLTINTVSNIGTTTNGATITANNNNATYQWLDCDNNNEPIEGATNQTFTATESGNYAVELTENGCTNTSACVAVNIIGIDELSNGLQAVVYPNPTQGNVEITLGSTIQDVELMLTDIQGRVIFTRNYPSLFKTNIELPDAKGVYVLKLKAQDNTSTLRLVKE